MIQKVKRISKLPKSCSYKREKQEQNPKKNSSVNGDFSKIFQEELKKLR